MATGRLGQPLYGDDRPLPFPEQTSGSSGPFSNHMVKGALLVGIFAAVFAVVGVTVKGRVFDDPYSWQSSPYGAEASARDQGKHMIVIRHNPREKVSNAFFERVMEDERVVARAKDFVWLREDTNGKLKRRDDDYGALRGAGGPRTYPHIFIYSPSGQVLDGHLEGNTMTPEQFLELVDEVTAPKAEEG